MTLYPRHAVSIATAVLALSIAGCTTTPPAATLAAGSQATIVGTIASIDTQPWTYDGNAVVVLDSAAQGRVSVQLPARWNLCKAGQVDVASLAVGQQARAVGTVAEDGSVVVCERAEHRLARVD